MLQSRAQAPTVEPEAQVEAKAPTRVSQKYGNAAAMERLSGVKAEPDPAQTEQAVADAKDVAAGKTSSSGEDTADKQAEGPAMAPPVINVSASSFEKQGLRAETLEKALTAYRTAWSKGETKSSIFTVIDYDMPSDQKRMFVIDLSSGKLLHHELVTHGSGSGTRKATKFSNQEGSNATSLGMARTAKTYQSSKFGSTALRLDGLEEGFNNNMRKRAVVMHRADYATPAAIKANANAGESRLGRSQGCPAMDPAVSSQVIQTIKNGTLIFSYAPDPNYLKKSTYLNPE